MKGRHAAILIIVILIAVAIAYFMLHDRSPSEPPPATPTSTLVAHGDVASRA